MYTNCIPGNYNHPNKHHWKSKSLVGQVHSFPSLLNTAETTNISAEDDVCFWTAVIFLLAGLRLWGESEPTEEDPGLAGTSSCKAFALEIVCVSRAARSLLMADCRECATGADFNEDTGDDGFDDTDESGDFGSCDVFLVDGCAAFGFFDC